MGFKGEASVLLAYRGAHEFQWLGCVAVLNSFTLRSCPSNCSLDQNIKLSHSECLVMLMSYQLDSTFTPTSKSWMTIYTVPKTTNTPKQGAGA